MKTVKDFVSKVFSIKKEYKREAEEKSVAQVSLEEDKLQAANMEASRIIEEAFSKAKKIEEEAELKAKEMEGKANSMLQDAMQSADYIKSKAKVEAKEIKEEAMKKAEEEAKEKIKEEEEEFNKKREAYEERIRIDKENLKDIDDVRFAYAGESLQEYRSRLARYCMVTEWQNKSFLKTKEWYPDSSRLEQLKEYLKEVKERNEYNKMGFGVIKMKSESTPWESFHGLSGDKMLILSLSSLSNNYFWDKFELLKENVYKIGLTTAERILTGIIMSLENKNLDVNEKKVQSCFEELRVRHEILRLTKLDKEIEKERKEQQREEARAQREFEREMKKAREDEVKALAALEKARAEAEKEKEDKAKFARLQEKIAGLEEALQEAIKRGERAQSMAQLTRHGTVYVISNIGSFGEGVYKIGLTRRLEPLERVHELGDASVPFPFDVHALIESDDAPALETALHQFFAEKKVNIINGKKEFFRVPLEEIKKKVAELGYETEWVDMPIAPQFRDSEFIRENRCS